MTPGSKRAIKSFQLVKIHVGCQAKRDFNPTLNVIVVLIFFNFSSTTGQKLKSNFQNILTVYEVYQIVRNFIQNMISDSLII